MIVQYSFKLVPFCLVSAFFPKIMQIDSLLVNTLRSVVILATVLIQTTNGGVYLGRGLCEEIQNTKDG